MSFETIPPLPEHSEETPTLSPEEIVAEALARNSRLESEAWNLDALLVQINPRTPEEVAKLEELRDRTKETQTIREEVLEVSEAAALETELTGIDLENLTAEQLLGLLEKYPALAENFLKHILEQNISFKTSSAPSAKDIEAAIEDLKGSEQKIFKGLALRTLERVLRAIISAGTLGIGAIVYDCIKDTIVSVRKRNEARATRRKLMNSTAVTAASTAPAA